MKPLIRIKSFVNGLKIQLSEEASFTDVKSALEEKLAESRKFFGNASVAITFEGKKLSEEEENELCDVVTENTDLDIICVIKEDNELDAYFVSSIRQVKDEMERNDIYFYKGNVINQQLIESKKDIVIIGDVNPGCTIISAKSIFVFGGLYGEAYAGVCNDEVTELSAEIIAAMEMAPEELKIGGLHYQPVKKHHWGMKPKLSPQIAFASNDKINIEPYTKELLGRILA